MWECEKVANGNHRQAKCVMWVGVYQGHMSVSWGKCVCKGYSNICGMGIGGAETGHIRPRSRPGHQGHAGALVGKFKSVVQMCMGNHVCQGYTEGMREVNE